MREQCSKVDRNLVLERHLISSYLDWPYWTFTVNALGMSRLLRHREPLLFIRVPSLAMQNLISAFFTGAEILSTLETAQPAQRASLCFEGKRKLWRRFQKRW